MQAATLRLRVADFPFFVHFVAFVKLKDRSLKDSRVKIAV
jgi:hypothetical protein